MLLGDDDATRFQSLAHTHTHSLSLTIIQIHIDLGNTPVGCVGWEGRGAAAASRVSRADCACADTDAVARDPSLGDLPLPLGSGTRRRCISAMHRSANAPDPRAGEKEPLRPPPSLSRRGRASQDPEESPLLNQPNQPLECPRGAPRSRSRSRASPAGRRRMTAPSEARAHRMACKSPTSARCTCRKRYARLVTKSQQLLP